MASFDYVDAAATASDLLAEFGGPVTLLGIDTGAYNTLTGKVNQAAPTNNVRNGVLLDFGQGQTVGRGGLIQGGDKRLLLEAGVVPALEDRLSVGGVVYIIKGLGEINPAGTPVIYDLHLRR